MIRTKSLYARSEASDGLRVVVMSRLTEQDGVTPLSRAIKGVGFDYWAKVFAPDPKAVGEWYRREISWDEFVVRYDAKLKSPIVAQQVDFWARYACESDVTFLCMEDTPEQCHRRLLAQHMKQKFPDLEILLS